MSWLIPELRCIHYDSPIGVCNECYTAPPPYRNPSSTIGSSVSCDPSSSLDITAESILSRCLGQSWQPSVSLDR